MSQKQIPLWLAVVTNINIIIGAAFFMGTSQITAAAGYLSPLVWILVGLFLMPLVFVLNKLSSKYPQAGGLYVYAQKTIGKLAGFMSGWGYFVGTLIGNVIVLHRFTTGLYDMGLIPTILANHDSNILFFNLIILGIQTIVSMKGIEMLRPAQIAIATFTFIPLTMVLLLIPFLGKFANIAALPATSGWLTGTFPMAIFAYIGIEASCALAHSIQDGGKNTGRAIYISLMITMGIYAAVQYGLVSILGASAAGIQPFSQIVAMLFSNPTMIYFAKQFIAGSIVISYLGGSYGMFYANNWNLFAMAKDGCIIGRKGYFTEFNKVGIPFRAVWLQSALMSIFFVFTKSEAVLYTMSDLGVYIAYITSTIAFMAIGKQNPWTKRIVGTLSLGSGAVLLGTSIVTLMNDGLIQALPFVGVLAIGALSFWLSHRNDI
jgi:basic amino acid/polyamine antiporter, APA family